MANNYDDCILENMKDVNSDTAAKAIIQACNNKYKKKENSSTKKYYYKDECTRKKTTNYDFEGEFKDINYNRYFVVTVTNKNSFRVYARFEYRKQDSNSKDSFIKTNYGTWVPANSTSIIKIPKDNILYANEGFTYSFDVSYDYCTKVKVEY